MPADPVALRDSYHRFLYAESCCVPIPAFPFRFATWAHVCGPSPGSPLVAPAEIAAIGDIYAFQHPSPPLGPAKNWFEPFFVTRYSLISGLKALRPGWVRALEAPPDPHEPRVPPGSAKRRQADCTDEDLALAYAGNPSASGRDTGSFAPPPDFGKRMAAKGRTAAVRALRPREFVDMAVWVYLGLLDETAATYLSRGRNLGRTAEDLWSVHTEQIISYLVHRELLAPDGAGNMHVVLPGSNWALALLRASWELLCTWLLKSEAGLYHWGFTSRYLQRLPDFTPFRGDLPHVDFGFCFGPEFHLLALDGRNVACVSNEGGTVAVIGDYSFEE